MFEIKENVSIPKAWDQLREKLPEGVKIIKYQTFPLSIGTTNLFSFETHRKKIRNKMKLRNNHLNLGEYFNLLSEDNEL
jgi:hypothetical protein